jgi:hypothetical protein
MPYIKISIMLRKQKEKISHKQHRGSITQNDNHPVSNTSINHVNAAKVPGYTRQHKGRPTLKKYKNFMLFIDYKRRLVYPSFQESKTASEACRSKCDYEKFAQRYQVTTKSYHAENGALHSETFQKSIGNKNQRLNFSGVNAQWQNGLVECSNGTPCAAARSVLNHAISRWDKTITAELWHCAIQHAATIYNTKKRRSRDYEFNLWEQFTGERSKLDQTDMHPIFCPVYVLDRLIQEGTSPPKWTKHTTQKVYVGHLHHYSKSVPMVWDPKTKLVSPKFHVMFDDNFDTAQAPNPNITQADTMDCVFKTNRYNYDDPSGKEHTYLFSHVGVDIHPDNLTPTIETCQASFTMTPTHDEHHSDTQNNTSTENTPKHKSIISMQDLVIQHSENIFPQSSRDDFKAYKHLHGIDMQIHSIPKSPKQKAHEMELSDLHDEEFKIFVLEYNISSTEPNNKLDHYVNTLQRHNEDFDPGNNYMFLNNLDPTFYAMQIQNPDVLTHAQMKQQVDAKKIIEAQRP